MNLERISTFQGFRPTGSPQPLRFDFSVYDGPFYKDSVASTASGLAAFMHTNIGTNGSRGGIQSAFLAMLRPLNDNGAERWSVPVSVYAKFRFLGPLGKR